MYKYGTAWKTVGVAEHIIKMDCREAQTVGSWLDLSSSVRVPTAEPFEHDNKYWSATEFWEILQ
jgi:hypothetical protein